MPFVLGQRGRISRESSKGYFELGKGEEASSPLAELSGSALVCDKVSGRCFLGPNLMVPRVSKEACTCGVIRVGVGPSKDHCL